MGQHLSAPLRRVSGVGLAIVLHLAALVWWLNSAPAIRAPIAPVETLTISLLSADTPPAPAKIMPAPTPAAKTPTPIRERILTLPQTAPTPEPVASAAPSAPSTQTSSASSASTSSSAPSAEPSAVVPPRFDAAYLANPPPPYPGLSRRMNETGRVLLRVKVSAEGLPSEVEVTQSSGYPRLDTAAREAVLGWKFIPARQGDKPVAASVNVPIVFKLN